ncbi:hypothetical protein Pve01_16930 [Planomonospora venezuelensis]|nr:hypothetical protein Pve01_16930 [Planomonospora venezuelensis]
MDDVLVAIGSVVLKQVDRPASLAVVHTGAYGGRHMDFHRNRTRGIASLSGAARVLGEARERPAR